MVNMKQKHNRKVIKASLIAPVVSRDCFFMTICSRETETNEAKICSRETTKNDDIADYFVGGNCPRQVSS